MGRLAHTEGLNDLQLEILKTVKDFVDKEVIPHRPGARARRHLPDRRSSSR